MPFFLNNRVSPLSLWPIPSKGPFVSAGHPKGLLTRGIMVRKRVTYLLGILALCVVIGFLFTRNRDVGIGAMIVVAYAGIFFLLRKTQRPKRRDRYPVIHYRGHPVRKKKKFFS
jgi:hypothetical protein